MRGRVFEKSNNTYEIWVANSGTSVSIIPINIAKKNSIKWRPNDPDKPNYSSVNGTQLTILGQTNIWIQFRTMKTAQEISVLECQEQSVERESPPGIPITTCRYYKEITIRWLNLVA